MGKHRTQIDTKILPVIKSNEGSSIKYLLFIYQPELNTLRFISTANHDNCESKTIAKVLRGH